MQNELLPKVKRAKNVIMNAGTKKLDNCGEEDQVEENVPKADTASVNKTEFKEEVQAKVEVSEPVNEKKNGDRFVLGIIIGALCSAALLSIVYWIIPLFMH